MYCVISNSNFIAFDGDSLDNNAVCMYDCGCCSTYHNSVAEANYNEFDDSGDFDL